MGNAIGYGSSKMHNRDLTKDYLERSGHRLEALKVLYERQSYADVVREAQEIIELSLKALLRGINVEAPRIHDVSETLLEYQDRLPPTIKAHVKKLSQASRSLRRDRELAFYGSEDLTPGEFYKKEDGTEAMESAQFVHRICSMILK